MGEKDSQAFTEHGIKNIYLSLLLAIPFCIVIFLTAGFGLTGGTIVAFAVGVLLVFLVFIKGMGDMLNGREELNEKHSSNVIMATVLSFIAIIVFLFLVVLSIISGAILTSSIENIVAFIAAAIVILVLSIAFMVLMGLSLIYYIQEIIPPEKKRFLQISFALLIGFPILSIVVVQFGQSFCILAGLVLILPLVLFVNCYKTSYEYLEKSGIKAIPLVPCPYCEHIIPVTSTSCRHCGVEFKKDVKEQLDPRLNMDMPKPMHPAVPHGYTPVEGPSEEQKRRVKKIITLIIVAMIAIAAVVIIIRSFGNDSENDDVVTSESKFIGTWQGGMYNGEAYETDTTWEFFTNGSLSEMKSEKTSWYTYYFEDGDLCRKDDSISFLMCHSFSFSNNDNTLMLSLGDIPSYQFNKIQ